MPKSSFPPPQHSDRAMPGKKSIHDRIMGGRPHWAGDDGAPASARRSLPRGLLLAGLAVALLAVGGIGGLLFARGLGFDPASAVNSKAQVATRGTPSGASDPFSAFAAAAGVKTCAQTYAKLGSALIAGSQFVFQTQTSATDPDRHVLQGTIGMRFEPNAGFTGQGAGVVLAAPNGTNCEGNSVHVVALKQSCEASVALLPAGSKAMPPLSGLAFFALPKGEHTLLLPVGTGCVAITALRVGA